MEILIDRVWNGHDPSAVADCFTPDAVVHSGGTEGWGGTDLIGRDSFRDNYVRQALAAFPDFHLRWRT